MRYFADDYCTVALRRSMGFVELQRFSFLHWSGRFVSLAITTVAQYLPAVVLRFVPVVGAAAVVPAIAKILKRAGFDASRGWAVGLTMAAIAVMPTPFQSLFWLTGFLVYTAPLIAAIWVVALSLGSVGGVGEVDRSGGDVSSAVVRTSPSRLNLIVVLTLVAAGSSDAIGIGLSVLALGYLVLLARRHGVRAARTESQIPVLAILCLWATTIVVLASPGNRARSTNFRRPSFATIVQRLPGALFDPLLTIMRHPASPVLAGIGGIAIARTWRSRGRVVAADVPTWLIGSTAVSIALTETLAIVGTGRSLAPRASAVLVYLCLGSIAAVVAHRLTRPAIWGAAKPAQTAAPNAAGPRWNSAHQTLAVAALGALFAAFLPLLSAVGYAHDVARSTDAAYAQIAATHGAEVTLRGPHAVFGLSNLGHTEPVMVMSGPLDRCMAQYFGKSTLSGRMQDVS